jgi:hypothetical protein
MKHLHLLLALVLALQLGGIPAAAGSACGGQAEGSHSCCSKPAGPADGRMAADCGCSMMPAPELPGNDLPGLAPEAARANSGQTAMAPAPFASPPVNPLLPHVFDSSQRRLAGDTVSFLSGCGFRC